MERALQREAFELWFDRAKQFEVERDALRAANGRLREAMVGALNELGVPQPGYPAPVTNAVLILRAALAQDGLPDA